ncbi:MAG: FkbH-like protein [Cyclobacteriaceae bacterium]|jgi:FkbH-like protein
MYESEIYSKSLNQDLSSEVLDDFVKTLSSIDKRSVLQWTEHCTECAMPSCFKTCQLYSPRVDGKCQRFVNGIQPMSLGEKTPQKTLKIQFKKWGVLASQGNCLLFDFSEAESYEKKDLKVATAIANTPIQSLKKKLIQKRYSAKKNKVKQNLNANNLLPDYFLIECFNPSDESVTLTLTIRNEDPKYSKIPFQYKIEINSGYNKELIPFTEIEKRIKTKLDFRIDLTPENIEEGHPLYFGLLEFVQFKEHKPTQKKSNKIKCIVWDLDNTLWHGILTESGVTVLKLRRGIKKVLATIEEKGILNSIASKNKHEDAIQALKHFGLNEYFVFPKISWQPKSNSIRELIKDLNISIDTLLFVDDSIFEREEVKNVFPNIKVLDAEYIDSILDLEEVQTGVTDESKNRKSFYLREEQRKQEAENFEGEYLTFLKSCEIKLTLLPLEKYSFQRVFELTQRTNQMNFSGNQYEEEQIEKIALEPNLDTYVMQCADKFGDYGIVGFAIIDKEKNRLIDLMFSCRIQSKKIEHAFINFCLNKYLAKGDFRVKYKRTERNKFSAQVFDDFAFEMEQKLEDTHFLVFKSNKSIPSNDVVEVIK